MSDIFAIERDDECICGSEMEFKKCCLPKVEQIQELILRTTEKEASLTALNRDFIWVLSVMYGMKIDGAEYDFDASKLADIILASWKHKKEVAKDLEQFDSQVEKILATKKRLRHVRIPLYIMEKLDLNGEDDHMDLVLDEVSHIFYIETFLRKISNSIRKDDYTDEELIVLFNWIEMGVEQTLRRAFAIPMLNRSLDDLLEAKENQKENRKEYLMVKIVIEKFNNNSLN